MNEWEARYKAILLGIEDKKYIDYAKEFVEVAIKMSIATTYSLSDCIYAMQSAYQKKSLDDLINDYIEKQIKDNLIKCLFKYFIYKIKKHLSKLRG